MYTDNRDAITAHLEEHLDYLLIWCSAEEYNSLKLDTFINAMTCYKPELLSQYDSIEHTIGGEIEYFHKIHIKPYSARSDKVITALGFAAAACIIPLLLLGINSSTKADPDTGFFHWLRKDITGETLILIPDHSTESTPDPNPNKEALEIMSNSFFVPDLPEMQLQQISYMPETDSYIAYFADSSDHYIEVGYTMGYDLNGYVYEFRQAVDGISFNFYSGNDNLGLYKSDRDYYVKGNISMEIIAEILKEYVDRF